MVDVGHLGALGGLDDDALGLLLGADEQHRPALGGQVLDELGGLLGCCERLTQVDDVDPVALREDVRAHLRVPAPGLVSEVDSSLQHLAHGDFGHGASLFFGWFLRPPSASIRAQSALTAGGCGERV